MKGKFMDFEYLDNESENVLWGLLKKDSVLNCNASGTAIELLVTKGYVNGKDCRTLSDVKPRYVLIDITQKGKTYFELKQKYEKEKIIIVHLNYKSTELSYC